VPSLTTGELKMLEYDSYLSSGLFNHSRRAGPAKQSSNRPTRARVKPECVHLYPGVNPGQWYAVVQEGEYKDDMEGLWIQVTDWVTYVLAKHFDLETRPEVH
jgi:hypothetical protein